MKAKKTKSSYAFVGVSYYLFPGEATTLDHHASKMLAQLTPIRKTSLTPVLKLLEGSIPDSFDEGKYQLWADEQRTASILVVRYGDTALLIGIAPPQQITGEIDVRKLVQEGQKRWKGLLRSGRSLEAYQTACVHFIELGSSLDQSQAMLPPAAPGTKVAIDKNALTKSQLASSSEFTWQLAGNNEHLIVSPADNYWMYEWCFNNPHLFRLLLFHGKANRYLKELLAINGLRLAGKYKFSAEALNTITQKTNNLTTAIENFNNEWARCFPNDFGNQSLGAFFNDLHERWQADNQKIADALKPKRKPSDKGAKVPKVAELDVSVLLSIKKNAFDANTFGKHLLGQFKGELLDWPSANKDRFVWKGEKASLVLSAAESGALDKAVRDSGGVAIASIKSNGEHLYDFIPEVQFEPAARTKNVREDELLSKKDEVDLVILTVTDIERSALLSALRPWPGIKSVLMGSIGRTTYRFGRFGNYRTAQVESKMGSGGSQGAMLTAQQAIDHFEPKAFLLLGIAFGVDRKKQRMGDVLVATTIFPYELQRKGKTVKFRSTPIDCGEILSERFRVYSPDWKLMAGPRQLKAQLGQVLSGEKLVDDKKFRDDLIHNVSDAIGGEMEGHGAYAAAKRAKIEMILVKGICDWADGHKNDRAQPFAAYAAVSLAKYVLSKPDVLKELEAVDINRSNSGKAPAKTSASKVNASIGLKAGIKATGPLEVFYSYAREDEKLKQRLEVHLATLRRENLISEWHDRKITPSKDWEGEINEYLERADLILFLVSPDFINSDYIHDVEMKRAMERHHAGKTSVIPIILRPCEWEPFSFGRLQALPRDGKPVTTWSNRDEAFLNIATGIRTLVEHLNGRSKG